MAKQFVGRTEEIVEWLDQNGPATVYQIADVINIRADSITRILRTLRNGKPRRAYIHHKVKTGSTIVPFHAIGSYPDCDLPARPQAMAVTFGPKKPSRGRTPTAYRQFSVSPEQRVWGI